LAARSVEPGRAQPGGPIASATGERYFRTLVADLARELEVEHVLAAWLVDDPPQIESVAFWSGGRIAPNLRCPLVGSPCEHTLRSDASMWAKDAPALFPNCKMLDQLQAQAYVGVPLSGPEGEPIGVLAALDSRPLQAPERVLEALQRFAPRTAGELARKRDEDALLAREQRLRQQNEALVALAKSRSAAGGDLQAFLREATETAVRTLGLDRALVTLFEPGGLSLLRVADLYDRGARQHESGLTIETASCPTYLAALERERWIDVSDVERDVRMRELWDSYFAPMGLRSTLDAPIRLGGRLVGALCNECRGTPRKWEADESQFAASVADLISLAIEASELRSAQRELYLRNRELTALQRISEVSLSAVPLAEALARVAFEVSVATGWPQAWIELAESPAESASDGASASARAARGQVQIHLRHEQRRLGTLFLAGRPAKDDPESAEMLESLARAIAGLVERTRAREQAEMLEERLRQTQNLKAIGTLAGGVAHDFNNLLTGILGYTWLLKQNADPTGEVYRAATVIENAAERAAELTRQLLGFARQGRHQEIELDLHALVREVTALLGRTFDRAIAIRHQLLAERSLLCGDPGQLHQALLNLAINARDAMPKGGELRFATEVISDQRVPRSAHPRLQAGDHLLLEVADSGSGIAAADLPHIFEPFFTTKAQGKGSGMGLAMVYGIVQDHAGAIEVHSQPGQGTTFRLYFPLLDEQRALRAKDSSGRPAASAPARGTGLVLVVDDEDLVRSMAKELLEELGYRVLTARDGIEGLEVYRESAQHVDLVLLDLVMPRMGGRECLRALQRLDPKVRVLLSSGWLGDEQERGAPLDGAAGFLPKPYQLAVLAAAVARALHV
jgi:two-component system, cell cycle sensor histidine kinase and response regulator CckA